MKQTLNIFIISIYFVCKTIALLYAAENDTLDSPSLEEIKEVIPNISQSFAGGEDEIIICLESIPGNFQNQKGIAETVDAIKKTITISTVISEEEFNNLSSLSLFPDKKLIPFISHYWLKKNAITGIEYFSIANNKQLDLKHFADTNLLKQNQKAYEELHKSIPETEAILKKLKTEIEDIESYLILELNLPPIRLDFIRNKFKEYYKQINFWHTYLTLNFTPEEFLNYDEEKETHLIETILAEIHSIVGSLDIDLQAKISIKELNLKISEFESFRTKILKYKDGIVEKIMQTMKNKGENRIIFIIDKNNKEVIFKELERRSISYVLIDPEKDLKESDKMAAPSFPEFSKLEMLFDDLIKNWTKEDTDYFLNKRPVILIENISIFLYKILKIYHAKDQLKKSSRDVITSIEEDTQKFFDDKRKQLKDTLEKELMAKTQKDYLTIKEMNTVNLAVSRQNEKDILLSEKLLIDVDKIRTGKKDELLIPFKLVFREKEIHLAAFIGENLQINLSDLKYLIEKTNIADTLDYKIIFAEGVDTLGEYSRLSHVYKDSRALEKIEATLNKVKEETQIKEETNFLTEEEKEQLTISTRDLSHKVAEKNAGKIAYGFDKVYKEARKEIEKIFNLYDKIGFTDKDVLALASTINSKIRDTFIFYLSNGRRVELNKEVAKLYIANTLEKQIPSNIISLIYSLDIAYRDNNQKELGFLKPMTKQALEKISDIDQIYRIFYLTLFSEPLFEDSKYKLSYKEDKADLFSLVETKLLFFNYLFHNPNLTVDQVEELVANISDSLLHRYRELKKKEHREIFDWEKEKLYQFEQIMLFIAHIQTTITTIKETLPPDADTSKILFREFKNNYMSQTKKEEKDFLNAVYEKNKQPLITFNLPKCKIWKQLQLSRTAIYDFIRYYFRKIKVKTRMYKYPSFESLFAPEILTKKWYEELEKTDILSRLSMELIVKPQNLHPVSDDLYLFDSATVAARFLLKYNHKRLDRIFVERIGENQAEILFIEFTKKFITNPFDQRIVEDIKAKFLLSAGNLEKIDPGITSSKRPENTLILRPLCDTDKETARIKTLVNNHPLLKYLLFRCIKKEKDRKLSLGNHIYIIRELSVTDDRIDKLFYIPSNSFFKTDETKSTDALIAHEAIHYTFYHLKQNLDLLKNLTYFFKGPQYKKFYSRILKIIGIDIKIDQEFYFKTELKNSINYRKLEELFALIAENLIQENTSVTVNIKGDSPITVALHTKDIEMLVLSEFLPFWMSPARLGYTEPTINSTYYDLSFNFYLNFLIEKESTEELTKFLNFWVNSNYKTNDNRRINIIKGFLKVGDLTKANKHIHILLDHKLMANQSIDETRQNSIKTIFNNILEDLSNTQKISFVQDLDTHLNRIEKLCQDLHLSKINILEYQFIIAYYLSHKFNLPEPNQVSALKNISFELSDFSEDKLFFNFIQIYNLFWNEKNIEEISTIMTNYTSYRKTIFYLQKFAKTVMNTSFYFKCILLQKKSWIDYVLQKIPSVDEILFADTKYRSFEVFKNKKYFNFFINVNKIQKEKK